MRSYTITVAPDDGDGATAVIQVEVAGRTPRLTNFSLIAAPNQSVSAASVAAINAELLLTALMPAFAGTSGARRPAVAGSTNGSATGTSPRRYMPADFVETYTQAATVAAVADHYRVPAHTAQAWVKTARRHGLIAPARSRK